MQIFIVLLLSYCAGALADPDFPGTLRKHNFKPPTSLRALGRIPQPGDLYERGPELILPDSLFVKALPEDKISTKESKELESRVSSRKGQGMTFEDLASGVQLLKEEKLSIALGITKPTGSSSFLTEVFGRSTHPIYNACISKSTVTRGISVEDVSKLVSLETLEKTNATDLIVSVTYGLATCYNLSLELPAIVRQVEGKAIMANFTLSPPLVNRSSDFVCHPEVIVKRTLVVSAGEVNRRDSQLNSDSPANFGEPIGFQLLPLSEVRKHLNVKEKAEIKYQEVPGHLSDELMEIAGSLHKVKNQLSEFWNRSLCQSKPEIPESKLSLMKLFVDSWSNDITASIAKMAEVVISYRTGSATYNNLTAVINQLFSLLPKMGLDRLSVEQKMNMQLRFLAEYQDYSGKLTSAGMKLITDANTFNRLMKGMNSFVVLQYKFDWIKDGRTDWKPLQPDLLKDVVAGNGTGLLDKYFLDCDVLPEYCENVTKTTVKMYKVSPSQKTAVKAKLDEISHSLQSSGLPLLTNASVMQRLIRVNKTFVVLKFKMDWILDDPVEWKQLRSIFLGYHGMWNWFGNPDKYLLDCGSLPEYCKDITKMVVNHYVSGQLEGAGDYLCAISKSFLKVHERNPYGAFWASWVIDEPFKNPYKSCRTHRVLTKYQGIFWDRDLAIII